MWGPQSVAAISSIALMEGPARETWDTAPVSLMKDSEESTECGPNEARIIF